MCLATCYWVGLDGIFYASEIADFDKFGGLDGAFIYDQFRKPTSARSLPEMQIQRADAVKVWKEYAALPGNAANEK